MGAVASDPAGLERAPEHRAAPFFVIGADRSGTTLLRLMLNEHPRLHVPRESYFLRDLVLSLPTHRPLRPDEVREAVRLIRTHPRWPDWEISEDELTEAVCELESPSLGDLADRVFRIGSVRSGKPRWGDKTPMYIHHLDRIHRLFPDAKFVHLIRDGRDVAVSLRRVPWHGSTVLAAAAYWSHTVGRGIELGRPLGSQYCEITYEDLVLDPEGTLRTVCAFIGEAFHPQMLRFHEGASEEIAPWEKGLHTKVVRPPDASDIQRWAREMKPLQVAVFESVAGRVMDAAGQTRHFSGLRRVGTAAASLPLAAVWRVVQLKRSLGLSVPGWVRRGWQRATGDAHGQAPA